MATIRQKKLAINIAEALGAKEIPLERDLLVSAGYDETTAKASPKKIIDSKGVQSELEKLGFTTQGADNVVQRILYRGKKEENQLKAADTIYKRLGAYSAEKSIVAHVPLTVKILRGKGDVDSGGVREAP